MATTNPHTAAPRRSKDSDKIGAFQRQEEIGKGSFATVYKAVHTVSDSIVNLVYQMTNTTSE